MRPRRPIRGSPARLQRGRTWRYDTSMAAATRKLPSLGTVFLTGATGFVGGAVLSRLLLEGAAERVFALVRARDAEHAERRGREVLFKLFGEDRDRLRSAAQRMRWVRGELGREGLGLEATDRDAILGSVDTVIHAAASTRFDLPEPEARAINFEGARRVLELARQIARGGRLRRLAHVSTAYVAGRRSGRIHEHELPGPEGPFSNTYEKTKAAAERLLRSHMGELPITVLRPSIIVGDSRTGRTYNFNVLYYPIKLLHRGLLLWCPGRRNTVLDIVPIDYVSEAICRLAADPEAAGGTFHLCAGDDAIPLRSFVDRIRDYYNEQRTQTGHDPLPRVAIIGRWRWRLILWRARRRLAGRAREQLEAFNLYLPYLLTEKIFDTTEARRRLGDALPYPPIASYLRKVAEYAVTREWGRRVSWDPSLVHSGLFRDEELGTIVEGAGDEGEQAAVERDA
ncbi:MAG: NAD-dependent epimerase/dehydratase family protein [Planctomycetota bacterium]|nr:MAG: NAD-dependent epimerase/dehydratase family protein [Planctomycetota bacterium]